MITLRNVLRVNALSSGLTGLLLAVFPGLFQNVFEVNQTAPFFWVGIFLVVFAIGVGAASLPRSLERSSVVAIITADTLWVVASIVLVAMPVQMSLYGTLIVLAVAAWVLMMAILQYRGLNETRPAAK